ncbi:transmembrane protein 169-like [Lineus longissimus]|uniref:transmembrane protein 169-like n=1 Tax=Lineus longissimus TaxID=88925 RepID=UPI002B4D033A
MASFCAASAAVEASHGHYRNRVLQKDRSSSTESSHSEDHKLLKSKSAGSQDRDASPHVLRRQRRLEQQQSAQKLAKEFNEIKLSNDEAALNAGLESAGNRIVTLTGTITRGHKAGQPVEVQLKLTDNELRRLSTVIDKEDSNPECFWGPKKGLHILIISMLFIPFSLLSSTGVAFYMGTVTWYNLYLYFSEEKTIWHKIAICPLLIIFYPVLIVVVSLSIGLYSAVIQVSWFCKSWKKEIRDLEKGFFGWLCNKINLSQCAPYEVVILDEKMEVVPVGEDVEKQGKDPDKDQSGKVAQTSV